MSIREHLILMAGYNAAMNGKMHAAAARLPAHELLAPRGAYFGSLLGTLNHLVAADAIWLRRFSRHPAGHDTLDPVRAMQAPTGLDQMRFEQLDGWWAHRQWLDAIIGLWVNQLSEADLLHVLEYANMKGVVSRKRMSSLALHFFNHQTHHRGQATTLLSQAGVDFGVTDLLASIPNE